MLEPKHIARGDNLRLPQDKQTARGALKLIDDMRGTAIIPNGHAVMRGSTVHYRALAGDVYSARIVAIADGRCVIDVDLPGCVDPVRLANVQLVEGKI